MLREYGVRAGQARCNLLRSCADDFASLWASLACSAESGCKQHPPGWLLRLARGMSSVALVTIMYSYFLGDTGCR